MHLSPQATIVRDHLNKTGSITAGEAWLVHGIRSLSARIAEMTRKQGYAFDKEHKRDVKGQRYVVYSYALGGNLPIDL